MAWMLKSELNYSGGSTKRNAPYFRNLYSQLLGKVSALAFQGWDERLVQILLLRDTDHIPVAAIQKSFYILSYFLQQGLPGFYAGPGYMGS